MQFEEAVSKAVFYPQTPQGGLKRLDYEMRELDENMYFGASAIVLESDTFVRKRMTFSEKLLWEKLKGKQVCGKRFRRQHPIGIFIAGFYCHEAKLVVEVDGEMHKYKTEYDDRRSAEMEKFGIKVIRFSNDEVENRIEKVIGTIEDTVNERSKSPPWGI